MTTSDKHEITAEMMKAQNKLSPYYIEALKRKADMADELATALEITIRDGGLIHSVPEQASAILKRYREK